MAVDDTTSQDRTTSRDRAGARDRAGEPVLGSPRRPPRRPRQGHRRGPLRRRTHTPPACVYARPVPATVPHGSVTGIDDSEAMALPGALAVLTHENAPRLGEPDDPILALLQTPQVPHRGWYVALAVAETPETAREMARAVRIGYAEEPHDVLLRADHPGLYHPEEANGGYPADQETGDFDTEYAAAPHRFDTTYTLGPLHNHPMEPHAATAVWEGGHLIAYDSSQGATLVGTTLAALFGLEPAQVTVVSEHVGGGFGSKGTPRPQVVLAAMAARHTGRAVKVVLPRRELPAVVGHRAPHHPAAAPRHPRRRHPDRARTRRAHPHRHVQGVRGAGGRALARHVRRRRPPHRPPGGPAGRPRTLLDAGPRRSARHVRARIRDGRGGHGPRHRPGRTAAAQHPRPGARQRQAVQQPPPGRLPARGRPPVRLGAPRPPRPGTRRDGDLLLGTGVAAATYPVYVSPSTASVQALGDGSRPGYQVRINATDIGTGARTVLAQIAAEELGVELDAVRVDIGSSDLPTASLAGGSSGTASWGWAVHKACRELRESGGSIVTVDTATDVRSQEDYARHAFGAVFAEVAVDTVTGEVRTRRLLGVFAAGRILNARTARSQFIGGMTMGLGMALTEQSTLDARLGGFVERDLAAYHVPAHADVPDIDAHWIEEHDPHLNPVGGKGIGEIGIVGTPAALANAVHHATGTRHRTLPLTPDRVGAWE